MPSISGGGEGGGGGGSPEKRRVEFPIITEAGEAIASGEFYSEPKIRWLDDKTGFHLEAEGVADDLPSKLRWFGLSVFEISPFEIYVTLTTKGTFSGEQNHIILKRFSEELRAILYLDGGEWEIRMIEIRK